MRSDVNHLPRGRGSSRGCISHHRDAFIGKAVALLLPMSLLLAVALAEAEPIASLAIAPGDVAVSGFSGTRASTDSLPPGVDLLDKTVIDLEGASLRVYDLTALGGAPAGQMVSPPLKFSVPAQDTGQVFPLVFDNGTEKDPPNLYAGATSAYGIQIVSTQLDADGTLVRVRNGGSDVRFMAGQFGTLPGSTPGTIYKIDGKTGEPSAIANTAIGGVANSGPGIGGLAFDPGSRTLYASDLDTGVIHRFALDQNAADLGQFDHGENGRPARGLSPVADDGKRMDITKPTFKPDSTATYGFTQPERRVRALAVHAERLYYAVDEGPEIWSVALGPDGSFNAENVRSELLVEADRPLPIASIVFDGQGRMTVAQRGLLKSVYDYGAFVEPAGTQVLRYAKEDPDDPATPGVWTPEPQRYAVGFGEDNKSAAGGAALQYAYRSDGALDLNACYGALAATADGLSPEGTGHGLQLNDAGLVLPAADPLQQSAFVEYDDRQNKADLLGHVGAVAVFHTCAGEGAPPVAGAPGYPPVRDAGGGGAFPPVSGGAPYPPIDPGSGGFPPVEGTPPVAGGPPVPPGIELHKSGVSVNCNENKNCTYEIGIENTTDKPINGPFVIEDTLEAGNATLNAAKITLNPNPPWMCTSAPPKFTCAHPGPIPANTTTVTTISFLPGPIGDAKEVKNCAVIASAPAPGGAAAAQISPPEMINGGGLKVELTPASATCSRTDGGCEWLARVTNTGPAALSGKVVLQYELFTGGIQPEADSTQSLELQKASAALKCSLDGDRVDCDGPPMSLAPNESFESTLRLKVTALPGRTANYVTNFLSAHVSPGGPSGMAVASIPFDKPMAAQANPAPPPALSPPPPTTSQGPELKIEAKAVSPKCSPGAGCAWDVAITNIGAAPVSGSLAITASVGVLPKPATAADKQAVYPKLVAASPPELACTQPDERAINCTNAKLSLPPGQSFPFKLTLKFDVLEFFQASFAEFNVFAVVTDGAVQKPTGSAHVRTAIEPKTTAGGTSAGASGGAAGSGAQGSGQGGGQAGGGPAAPQGGQPAPPAKPACATIPVKEQEPLQLKIEKKATVASCANKGGCAFQIDIANTGTAEIAGPITVSDTVFVDEMLATSVSLDGAPPAPWTCTPAAHFSCTHPGPLAAGAALSLPLSIKEASGKPAPTKIKNCAAVPGAAAQACAEIAVVAPPPPPPPPPPQLPNLAVEVSAETPTCPLKGWCQFDVRIINRGTGDYKGKLSAFNNFFSGNGPGRTAARVTSRVAKPLPWSCTNPDEASLNRCNFDELFDKIVPGEGRRYVLNVSPGAEWAKNNILTLCAQLWRDLAGNDTFDPQKPKEACASVRLDPFAVEIKKSGGQSCAPGDGCRFDLEIFNPGPILHDDPVTVTDKLTGLGSAPIVSIVPAAGAKPFPCAPAPTEIPFTCSGHMRLEINERQKYTMTVRLPPNAPGSGAFKNCASIASSAGTKSEEDCHEVKLAPACTGGRELDADGSCVCPPGEKWNGRLCVTEKEACPPSKPVGTPPNCCAKGLQYRDGACRCRPGTQLDKRGVCIAVKQAPAKCPPNRPVGTPPNCCPKGMLYRDGACRCPEGRQLNSRGVCIPIVRAPEKCPPNRPVGTPPNCCPQNSQYKNGACVCPPGTTGVPPFCNKQPEAKPQKQPELKSQKKQCSGGMVGTPPDCKCPPGTEWSRRFNACRPAGTRSQPEPKACVPYGQACRSAGECCNGVPCSGGLCRYN